MITRLRRHRKAKGNMLLLSGVCLCVAALATLLCGTFACIFFVFNRVQTTADEMALAGARKLNEYDRVGQMNNMIARSRQLVFASHEDAEQCASEMPFLHEVAETLYQEARDGAHLLESERKYLRNLNVQQVNDKVMEEYNRVKATHSLVLPCIRVSVPEAPVVRIGCCEGLHCNVAQLDHFEDVVANDADHAYLSLPSKLYKEHTDLGLPGAEPGVNFKVSSLPAPVDKHVAPARVALAIHYKPVPGDHLQSCVQVEMKITVATMIGPFASSTMVATGTAVANGGQLQQ